MLDILWIHFNHGANDRGSLINFFLVWGVILWVNVLLYMYYNGKRFIIMLNVQGNVFVGKGCRSRQTLRTLFPHEQWWTLSNYINLFNERDRIFLCIFTSAKRCWQWMSECFKNVTIIYQLSVSVYYQFSIMIFCSIAHY